MRWMQFILLDLINIIHAANENACLIFLVDNVVLNMQKRLEGEGVLILINFSEISKLLCK